MTDDRGFEPRLGQVGKDRSRRPRSQLSALARSARWGKVRTFERPRLAAGKVRNQGRGNGAAAAARHHAYAAQRRVRVQTSISVMGAAGKRSFTQHLAYISRDGTSPEQGPGRAFDREASEADLRAFTERARNDVRQFRWMVMPFDAGEMQDLETFTRTLMKQVERDLGCEVDWVAAAHYNIANPHIHIVVRGGDPEHDELIIARRYLAHGLRCRASEIVTNELGPRSEHELSIFRSPTVNADRYTFIDRDLAQSARGGVVDISRRTPLAGRPDWSLKCLRLHHLKKRGLARHVEGSTWRLREGWRGTLQQMTRQCELHEAMPPDLALRFDPGKLQAFSTGTPGAAITGRLSAVVIEHQRTGRHIAVIDGLDGRHWTAGMPAREARGLPEPGSVVTIVAPPVSHGAAPGALTAEEADPAGEPAVPRFIVQSWIPVGQLVRRRAYTWLDDIDEASLGPVGFGAEVREARIARRAWLASQGLQQASRQDLEDAERAGIAADLATRLGKRYVTVAEREVFRGTYHGFVDTAQGRFAVIAGEGRFTLAAWREGQAPVPGQQASVERSSLSFGTGLARGPLRPL
jgi:Protein of unknown function (DUF3363)